MDSADETDIMRIIEHLTIQWVESNRPEYPSLLTHLTNTYRIRDRELHDQLRAIPLEARTRTQLHQMQTYERVGVFETKNSNRFNRTKPKL